MTKANAGKPDHRRKPGGEGLPYKSAEDVAGGPIEEQPKGSDLGAGHEVKGGSKLPPVKK